MQQDFYEFLKTELGDGDFQVEHAVDQVMIQFVPDRAYYFSCSKSAFNTQYVFDYTKITWHDLVKKYYDTDRSEHIINTHQSLCMLLIGIIRKYRIQNI
jgi:hypothetical protein